MSERHLRILQVSTRDIAGGAEKVAWNLFDHYRTLGQESWLAVGFKHSRDPNVVEIPRLAEPGVIGNLSARLGSSLKPLERLPGVAHVRHNLNILARGWPAIERRLGGEDIHYPGSRLLLSLVPKPPDVIHLHNLHGGYFDLRFIAELSQQVPVVLTLHDEWLLTGHCAYTMGCPRWEQGCGSCPDLEILPSIRRDATAWNWRRKRRIYRHGKLYISTPSRWLMDRVDRSMLVAAEKRVIPYGIDLDTYKPGSKESARSALNLSPEENVLLFAANWGNPFKDFKMIEEAIRMLGESPGRPLTLLSLGSKIQSETTIGRASIRSVPFLTDPEKVALYYQAADVFLHAAKADNFPNTILESLACGTPVVGTAVGGIPEQIIHGRTGYLVPEADPGAMASAVTSLMDNPALLSGMSAEAAEFARIHFDLSRMASQYL
ncbi:MAG: glycosyltransferase, partial [Verrucomicrobiota bacterium]|nr:glycosyltransferase [Verrucomicrobiota bacterium]